MDRHSRPVWGRFKHPHYPIQDAAPLLMEDPLHRSMFLQLKQDCTSHDGTGIVVDYDQMARLWNAKYLELLREGRAGTMRETLPSYLRKFHEAYRKLEAVQIGSQPTLLAQHMQLYAARQRTGTQQEQQQQQQPSTPSAEDAAGALLPLSQVSELEGQQAPPPQQRHHGEAAPAAAPRQPQRATTAPAMALQQQHAAVAPALPLPPPPAPQQQLQQPRAGQGGPMRNKSCAGCRCASLHMFALMLWVL